MLTIIDRRLPALVNLKASTAIQLTANKKILELYQVITMMEATVLTRTLFMNQVAGEFFYNGDNLIQILQIFNLIQILQIFNLIQILPFEI